MTGTDHRQAAGFVAGTGAVKVICTAIGVAVVLSPSKAWPHSCLHAPGRGI